MLVWAFVLLSVASFFLHLQPTCWLSVGDTTYNERRFQFDFAQQEVVLVWEKTQVRNIEKEDWSKLISQVLKKMKGKMPEMAVNYILARAMQVVKEYHGILHCHNLLLQACTSGAVTFREQDDLKQANTGPSLLDGLPHWVIKYAAGIGGMI